MEKLSGSGVAGSDMGKWVLGLKLCVSHLDEDCGQLVAATLVCLSPLSLLLGY